jgi:two-component system, sporulation sensor kinase B
MKEFYTHINKRKYYLSMIPIITLMVMGLITIYNRYDGFELPYIIHILLVLLLSTFLLLYPKYEIQVLRTIIIIVLFIYFYMLFFFYPETLSTFVLICLIPAMSIYFFDIKLFYFTLILNGLLLMLTFGYIVVIDQGNLYPYIKQDLVGNIINFFASQVVLYSIFKFSNIRLKKQQLYFEEIQQSERIKTSGQLAAAIAHEIRNPLTVVKGFLELYKEDVSMNSKVKEHFSLMIGELNTAEHVISQLLTVSKPSKEVNLELIDVGVTLISITDLLKSYSLLHDNTIELEVKDDCRINANLIEFKQLIINLIKNSIEASNPGDTISVIAEKQNDLVEIKIIDSGCGMSKEEIKSLGSPYYSLKSKGTGLGLMICYNIVEKNNGTIKFQSVKGSGTTTTLNFPLIYRS